MFPLERVCAPKVLKQSLRHLIPIEISDDDKDKPTTAENSLESSHEIDDVSETSAKPITIDPEDRLQCCEKRPKSPKGHVCSLWNRQGSVLEFM